MTPTIVWRHPTPAFRLAPTLLLLAALLLSGLLPSIAPPSLPDTPRLSPHDAASTALSGIPTSANPLDRMGRYTFEVRPEGAQYRPRFGGPALAWQLTAVRSGDMPAPGVLAGPVAPTTDGAVTTYDRGALIERYVPSGATGVERQLVIAAPLGAAAADLTIEARLSSTGAFAAGAGGWEWRTDRGAITLSPATVTDAAGATLPASIEVGADSVQLAIDGGALAGANFPVMVTQTVSQELAITDLSAAGLLDAFEPAVAYSPATNSYLVVFSTDLRRDTEYEIYGQFVDAADGARSGQPFLISQIGTNQSNDIWDSFSPDVAYAPPGSYSSADGTTSWAGGFLVTWTADNNNPPEGGYNANGSFEVYAQLVSESGQLLLEGSDRISTIIAARWATGGNPIFPSTPDWDAFAPSVAFDPVGGEFLICWSSDRDSLQNTAAVNGGAFEIWCKLFRLAPAPGRPYFGSVPTGNEIAISAMGPSWTASPTTYTNFDAYTPDVAYKPFFANGEGSADDEPRGFFVVWSGDDDRTGMQDGEFEIFGQVVVGTPETIQELVSELFRNDGRISRIGDDTGCADAGCDALFPAVAFNPDRGHYLVAFTGDNVNGQEEVFVSLRNRVGNGISAGTTLQQVSLMGGADDSAGVLEGREPSVAYDAGMRQYMLAWRGDNLTNDRFQVYAQRLDAATPSDDELANSASSAPIAELGAADEQVGTSPVAPVSFFSRRVLGDFAASAETDRPFDTFHSLAPDVATTGRGDFLVVWAAETDAAEALNIDIRGQLFQLNGAPVITVPANIVVAPTSLSGAVVAYAAPTAIDPEDGPLTPSCASAPTPGLASGSTFPIGRTTITCSASDRLGKGASKSFIVEVSAPDGWANLGLSQSIAPSTVRAGGTVTSTFTIVNSGPAEATSVLLTVTLPGGVSFTSGSASCAQRDDQVVCPVGSVPNGGSAEVLVTYSVAEAASGSRTIRASVGADTTDPSVENNSAVSSFRVDPGDGSASVTVYLPLTRR